MSRLYLGIDTSNYRTSVAIFDAVSGKYKNCGRLLDVPAGMQGLRQSDALFQHTLHLHEQITGLTTGIGHDIKAVCVSTRPRAVEGSYMPCFLAGESVARSIAHLLGVPCYAASHQQGHLAAAACGAKNLALLSEDFLAWHLSGGTTELLRVSPGIDGLPKAEIIGGTTDISAGQLVDRTGVLLGLNFPAGAALERIADASLPVQPFLIKLSGGMFSLSGMQNRVEQMHKNGENPEAIARFVVETILYAVTKATSHAMLQHTMPVLCAGGVMSNLYIQQKMSCAFGAYFAPPDLSGDNAVGVAILAAQQNREDLW